MIISTVSRLKRNSDLSASVAFLGLSQLHLGFWINYIGAGVACQSASAATGIFVYGRAAAAVKKKKTVDVSYEPDVRFTAMLQWVFFLIGLGLVAVGFWSAYSGLVSPTTIHS